jgi:hypothetical protein
MRTPLMIGAALVVNFFVSPCGWAQGGDTVADARCRSENQRYCDNGVEKVCTRVGTAYGRPIWFGAITGHNQNCPPVRPGPSAEQKNRCYALMNQWNAKRNNYNTGQCRSRIAGSAVDIQCQQLKAALLQEQGSIESQCRGIIENTPNGPTVAPTNLRPN